MDISIDRRRLLLASIALGAASGGTPAQAAAPGQSSPIHPDLAVKLIIVGRRRPGTTLAEHRHHIRKVHGELVLQNIAADPANAYLRSQVAANMRRKLDILRQATDVIRAASET